MSTNVKIQLSVPPDLARAVRMYLADNDRAKKGELSDFFTDLARAHISEWLRHRAASTGRLGELTPAGLEVLVRTSSSEPSFKVPEEPQALRPPAPFTDAEILALVRAAQDWATPSV